VRSRESYWFVSPKETADTPRVKAFRDWVKSELRPLSRARARRS
jgi:DNA-binding transcriptional LysR family regulator